MISHLHLELTSEFVRRTGVFTSFGPPLRSLKGLASCVRGGFVDTERFDHMAPEKRAAMLEATGASLPLQRATPLNGVSACHMSRGVTEVGEPQEVGEALYFLATNSLGPWSGCDFNGLAHVRLA